MKYLFCIIVVLSGDVANNRLDKIETLDWRELFNITLSSGFDFCQAIIILKLRV